MNASHRPDTAPSDARPQSPAAARAEVAAIRRAQLEQVRAAVRMQLAEIHRRRQELSARRKAPR